MTYFRFNLVALTGLIVALVLSLSNLSTQHFDLFTTNADILLQHQYWRWLSCNFVHFGWMHSLMNAIGFLLVSLTLFSQTSVYKFLFLFLFCCISVGLGMFITNSNMHYAGLSGVIHGIVIAGCFYATEFAAWKRILIFLITTGKIIHEQIPGYDANPLHNLIPVPIAVDAHLIGAIAGLVFYLLDKMHQLLFRLKQSATR